MAVTAIVNPLPVDSGRLRPFDVRRDLKPVADLVELCFRDTLDQNGQRYLKQMRDAARHGGLLSWAGGFAEQASLPMTGFVWEEDGRVVGNLTLIPFHHEGRRIYLIANVAVHPDYRRRGIARALTLAGVDHARSHRAASVWLHVRQDNEVAVQLYQSLGFIERAVRTTWRSRQDGSALFSETGKVAPAYAIGPRRRVHWPQQHAWLERLYPPELAWHFPLKIHALRADLSGSIYRLLVGASARHWVAQREKHLAGVLTWQSFHTSADVLWLATPPEAEDEAIYQLLRCARRGLSPRRPLALDFPAGLGSEAIRRAGFHAQTTLVWMENPISR